MNERISAVAAYGLAALLACLCIAGCNSGDKPKAAVHGKVTIDGLPLSEGAIYFKTVATGDIESLPISNGEYSGDVEVGERRVEIASIQVETKHDGGMTSQVETNVIPARYNTNSTLTANVTKAGPNEFDFPVTSK